jgi:hypothetical protein
MKHRGPIAGPRPLPDPNGPGEVEALLLDARREIKDGTHPDQLFKSWLFRNTVTDPPWTERKLQNIFEQLILNDPEWTYYGLWKQYHVPAKPELDPSEEFAFEQARQHANLQCKRVMELLNCSYSRAYAIMTNGTAKPAQARILAAGIAGTTESEWMRPALPPGRKPPPAAPAIKALRIDGCSLFDFIESVPRDSKLERTSEAVAWLKKSYRSEFPPDRHFESFVQFKKELPPVIAPTDAERVWDAYKVWRVERITDALEADLLDSRS